MGVFKSLYVAASLEVLFANREGTPHHETSRQRVTVIGHGG